MMFLIRVAFWLSVVVLLLPTGQSQQETPGPKIGTTEAVSAAGAAVSDMRQFCTRQPDACTVGSQAAVTLGHKAQAGAKMLYDFLNDRLGPQETGSVAATKTSEHPAASGTNPASQHTLTPSDVAPAW